MRIRTFALLAAGSLVACSSSSDDGAGPPAEDTTGGNASSTSSSSGASSSSGTGSSSSGGTSTSSGGTSTSSGGPDGGPDMTAVNKHKAEMLTTLWENDTTIFQYAFARNNNDGFGYTAGRVGFTTATGDGYAIVKCFDAAYTGAGNLMKKYEAPLAALDQKRLKEGKIQPDTSTLDAQGNYPNDWKATANDPKTHAAFALCQDQRVDNNYWTPTLALIKQWGLQTALSRASFYDAMIVHGEDNVKNLIKQANTDIGSPQTPPAAPLSTAQESKFLEAFLKRRTALINSSPAWKGAIARGANYEQQRRNGNLDFAMNIVTNANANTVFPGQGYGTMTYQACVIAPDGTVTGPAQCTAPVSN